MTWIPTAPAGEKIIYSQSYQLSGDCDGNDMVYRWGINGQPGGGGAVPASNQYGASFIYPWCEEQIFIRGVELVVIPPSPGAIQQAPWPSCSPGSLGGTAGPYLPSFGLLMVGNNVISDAMLFMEPGKLRGTNWFPGGTSMPFPGIPDKTPLSYIDLHGNGTPGYHAVLMLTLYYTK